MDENPVEAIRENSRNVLNENRQQQRDDNNDHRRAIGSLRVTPETVQNIANKLKTKAAVSLSELHTLKIGLVEDVNHKIIFLNTHGSTRGLVRELTGTHGKKRCAAAECLCNLALGDDKMCKFIAKLAGPYLITALENFNTELAIACVWTIGNLAGTKAPVCNHLIAQGVMPKLYDVVQGAEECVQEAAFYALVHFAFQLQDTLQEDHLERMLQEITNKQLSKPSSHLLFILSCHKDFPAHVTDELIKKIVYDLPKSIDVHLTMCMHDKTKETCCKLMYLFRALANMDVTRIYTVFLDHIVANNLKEKIMQSLSSENMSMCLTLLWLLGNLFNHNQDHTFFHDLYSVGLG